MTFANSPTTTISERPARVRFLAEMPLDKYTAIDSALQHQPDWDRFFIFYNPVNWPDGMHEVIEYHLGVDCHIRQAS